MSDLEKYVDLVKKDPNYLNLLEEEVSRLVIGDIADVLQFIDKPILHTYVVRILEMRLKHNKSFDDPSIYFNLVQSYKSDISIHLLNLCFIYFYPKFNYEFKFDEFGLKIFDDLLFQINNNEDISHDRRNELKKVISLSNFNPEIFNPTVISIYKHFLKILPANFNIDKIYENFRKYPTEIITFIDEALSFNFKINLDLLDFVNLPVDDLLIKIFINKKYFNERSYQYAYSGDIDSFLMFFTAAFEHKPIHVPIILEKFITFLPSKHILIDKFYNTLIKNSLGDILLFIYKNEEVLKDDLFNLLLKIYKKSQKTDLTNYFTDYKLNTKIGQLFIGLIKNDNLKGEIVNCYTESELKLALMIYKKYDYSNEELKVILDYLNTIKSHSNAFNELIALIFLKLNIKEDLSVWDLDKVKRFYIYTKKDQYLEYKDSFINAFLNTKPFDRCFKILERLTPTNSVLQHIYNSIEYYTFDDITYFNYDLLLSLSSKDYFIEKEIYLFVTEYDNMTDHTKYYNSLKSLIHVMERSDLSKIINTYINLFNIDYPPLLNKIIQIFEKYNVFDTRKDVYLLLKLYNTTGMELYSVILSGLHHCLKQEDGLLVFKEIINKDLTHVRNLKNKNAINALKDCFADFKAVKFNKMFEEKHKIDKQNIFKRIEFVNEDENIELEKLE